MYIESSVRPETRPKALRLKALQIQWGWITPGTCLSHRKTQSSAHLEAMEVPPTDATRHVLFVHCGWWLDARMRKRVRAVMAKNPEPFRNSTPASSAYLQKLTNHIHDGRLEYIAYPYAACVTEATSAEGLFRSFRLSRDIAKGTFGREPRVYMGHDAVYGLDWGTPQAPQIIRLLGGSYLVSGREGTILCPDGTEIQTFGHEYGKSFYEMAKNPESFARPGIFCMEMHEHLRHMDDLNSGEHFLSKNLGVGMETLTLDEYLKKSGDIEVVWPSTEIGSKGWYGGIIDSLLLEQQAKSVELRLPAIEALLVLDSPSRVPKFCDEITDLWKRTMILMDNHLLWQCHQFRPYFLERGEELVSDCQKLESRVLCEGGSKSVELVFNPVPWKRSAVLPEGDEDILYEELSGWAAGKRTPARRAAACLANKSSPYHMENELIRYRLGSEGQIENVSGKGVKNGAVNWGRILGLREEKSSLCMPLQVGDSEEKDNPRSVEHIGCATLTAEVDLTTQRSCFEGFFEFGRIEGDAYLLKVERLDLTGKIFDTKWHQLRSLHWVGNGMPQQQTEAAAIPLKMAYTSRLRLTIWLASEKPISMTWARIRHSLTRNGFLPITNWTVRGITDWKFEEPKMAKARVVRESTLAKEVAFTGKLHKGHFELRALLEAGSPCLKYCLKLHYAKPTQLGVSTPPFTEDDGSLFGAACERPCLPALMVVSELPDRANFYVDKPAYIQQALDSPKDTWHTDRKNWWLGMSPFIGMNMAVADWTSGSVGMFTRGIKHFFRWQRKGREWMGLSLGTTRAHVCTQGHSVPEDHPLFPLAGRLVHDPYPEMPFLRARGDYSFDYAFRPRLKDDRPDALDFWKAAQEFALPVRKVKGSREVAGLQSSAAEIIATGLEEDGDILCLRVVNLSENTISGSISLPFSLLEAEMEKVALALEDSGKSFRVQLPPWAIREVRLQKAAKTINRSLVGEATRAPERF